MLSCLRTAPAKKTGTAPDLAQVGLGMLVGGCGEVGEGAEEGGGKGIEGGWGGGGGHGVEVGRYETLSRELVKGV